MPADISTARLSDNEPEVLRAHSLSIRIYQNEIGSLVRAARRELHFINGYTSPKNTKAIAKLLRRLWI